MPMKWRGSEVGRLVAKGSDEGAYNAANKLLELSLPEVPYDEGILEASGHVRPEGEGTYVVSYGHGMAEEYAIIQHERLDYNHPKKGKAKYLEDPLNQNREELLQIMAEGIRDKL